MSDTDALGNSPNQNSSNLKSSNLLSSNLKLSSNKPKIPSKPSSRFMPNSPSVTGTSRLAKNFLSATGRENLNSINARLKSDTFEMSGLQVPANNQQPLNNQINNPINNQLNSQVQSQSEITQNLTQQLINSTSDNNQTNSDINQQNKTQITPDSQNPTIITQLSQKYANNPSYLNNAYNNNQFQNNGNQYFDNYNSMVNMDQPQSVPSSTSGIREPVGFATLPNQIHQKAVRRGFEFTLMVCGESGLGKSTLLNSLFLTDVYSDQYPGPSRRHAKTLSVQETDVQISEGGVNLTLTIVDTPGYGDSINNTSAWNQVNEFIEQKFEKFLNGESRVTRMAKPTDKRVHCCLYFIAPTGHGMKALDIEFMKRLHDKVNIIPVISKADAMTPEEIKSFKAIINQQIAENLIHVYSALKVKMSRKMVEIR